MEGAGEDGLSMEGVEEGNEIIFICIDDKAIFLGGKRLERVRVGWSRRSETEKAGDQE